MELGAAFANVSNFTLKNLVRCSKHTHDGRLNELVAQLLPLIQLVAERGRGRIHCRSLRAHNKMFDVLSGDRDRW